MARKGLSYVVMFRAVDSTNRPAIKSGLSIANTDIQISKDGGAFANATNGATELGTTGFYYVTLTAAEMAANFIAVKVIKAGMDDVPIFIMTEGHPTGTVVDDAANTASTFETDLAETTTDYWKDALLLFTSGTMAGQVKKVSGYNGSSKFITVSSAFTAEPTAGDRFILINI